MNFKRLSLTDHKVDIPRLASKKVLKAKVAASGEVRGSRSKLIFNTQPNIEQQTS